MKYVLASKSPRRREILENLGLQFEIVTADTDENASLSDPCELVELLAERKGRAVAEKLLAQGVDLTDTVIIASDTVVATESEILGKPRDKEDARRMLTLLSGSSHRVVSGVCLIGNGKVGTAHEVTEVLFDTPDAETLERYLQSDEPYDKAGGYAIQGHAATFIRGIKGCYFNVVGLPVHRLCCLYRALFGENFL